MLQELLKNFLNEHMQTREPLLVACSGGVDSLALAHALLQLKKKQLLTFELAHLDHGLRKESASEAEQLKRWAEENDIVIHIKAAQIEASQNLEDECRRCRYAFFSELMNQNKYQALLTAHHNNDLQETVLKRLLEGSLVPYIKAMNPVMRKDTYRVWRPLLAASKKQIIQYNQKYGLKPIEDPTNYDGSNLRSKMRQQMLPFIEKQLGKNIGQNLSDLYSHADQIYDYLEGACSKKYALLQSDFGKWIDFSLQPTHSVEGMHMLKKLGCSMSKEQLKTAVKLVLERACNKHIPLKEGVLWFDRAQVILVKPLKVNAAAENWQLQPCLQKIAEPAGWQQLFNSDATIRLAVPDSHYKIMYPHELESLYDFQLKKN